MAHGNTDNRQADHGPRDRDRFWTQGNYAPVCEELTAEDLAVTGEIPEALDGLYVRNGANPRYAAGDHWFLGNGMVHGVRIGGGRALWYRNRFVQTPLLAPGPRAPGPPALTDNASNVALVHHAGRLLSLGEVGLPYELSPHDLSTRGVYDFEGKLATCMTAHPKLDPESGELLFFGYDWKPPYLTHHVADASGALARTQAIELPGPAMMHDFALTRRHVLFLDLPILFNLELAIAGDALPFRWDDRYGARIGVMPRAGAAAHVRWFEIEPCFAFHVMNAYEDAARPDVLVLDLARYPKLWHEDNTSLSVLPQLHRYRIDLQSGQVHAAPLAGEPLEFPVIDPRRTGRPYRFGYGLELRPSTPRGPGGVAAVLKLDHHTQTRAAHVLHPAQQADEVTFVPLGPDAGEDEGYLLFYLYDQRSDRSELVILDAQRIAAAPLARIALPQRVPFGFHGTWVAQR